jgi:hypothetical protein
VLFLVAFDIRKAKTMSDPVTLSMSAGIAPPNAPHVQSLAQYAPADTKRFHSMMQRHSIHSTDNSIGASVRQVSDALEARFGGATHSLSEAGRGLMDIDFADPIKAQLMTANYTVEALGHFNKLHIAVTMATAATSLLGTFLKNPQ